MHAIIKASSSTIISNARIEAKRRDQGPHLHRRADAVFQRRSLLGLRAHRVVRAAGLEPAQLFRAEGFSYHFGFRRLALARSRIRLVCGLDYTFTIARSRIRCCPSSLYTFAPAVRLERLARDCLLPVSPSLSSSAPRVSPGALNCSSPLRLPISPRPRSCILAGQCDQANEEFPLRLLTNADLSTVRDCFRPGKNSV
jgi:hypothetical protein